MSVFTSLYLLFYLYHTSLVITSLHTSNYVDYIPCSIPPCIINYFASCLNRNWIHLSSRERLIGIIYQEITLIRIATFVIRLHCVGSLRCISHCGIVMNQDLLILGYHHLDLLIGIRIYNSHLLIKFQETFLESERTGMGMQVHIYIRRVLSPHGNKVLFVCP